MDTTKTFDIPTESIIIEPDEIFRILGYSKSAVPEPVHEKVQFLLPLFDQIIKPVGGFVLFPDSMLDVGSESLTLDSINFNTGHTIASQIEGSEYIGVIIASAGSQISDKSHEFIGNGDYLEGYIVDAVGSLVAESVADIVQNYLKEHLASIGLNITNRLSPGYCGWDVSEQHKLFSLLPDYFCGVALNESALMSPIKSISAIIGIGQHVEPGPYPCSICTLENCYMRRPT
jgi:hypothetical protein